MRRGITRDKIQPGMTIVVQGFRAKEGSNNANGGSVTFTDGRTVFTAGAEDKLPETSFGAQPSIGRFALPKSWSYVGMDEDSVATR